MEKNKRGITLVSVLIIIVVLSIITATATVSIHYIINNTFKKAFVREYSLVKASLNDYIIRNSGIIDFEEEEIDLSELTDAEVNQFNEADIRNNKVAGYIVDLEKIGVVDATYGIETTSDDIYVVSKNTNTLYYKKGFTYNNTVYHVAVED